MRVAAATAPTPAAKRHSDVGRKPWTRERSERSGLLSVYLPHRLSGSSTSGRMKKQQRWIYKIYVECRKRKVTGCRLHIHKLYDNSSEVHNSRYHKKLSLTISFFTINPKQCIVISTNSTDYYEQCQCIEAVSDVDHH